jgi:hypothetical protein
MRATARPSLLNLILHSYVADLQKWGTRLVTGYAVAFGVMLTGPIFLIVAAGIGVTAAFHFLEMRYGAPVAYGAIGGVFFVLGLAALLTGSLMLQRPLPAIPRPGRQAAMLKSAITASVAARLVSTSRPGAAVGTDHVARVLAAAAAVTLVGWIVASRFNRAGTVRG